MDILAKTIILAVSEIFEGVAIGNTMMFCFHLGEGHENQVQKAYEVLKAGASNVTPVGPCDYSPCQFRLIDKSSLYLIRYTAGISSSLFSMELDR